MKRVDTGTAGKQLGRLVEEVRSGGEVVLTRYGRDVARIIPVDVPGFVQEAVESATLAAESPVQTVKPSASTAQRQRDDILRGVNRGR